MTTKPLIKESLLILDICGLNPTESNVRSKIRRVITIVVMSIMISESFMEVVFNLRKLSVDVLAEFTTFYQIYSKMIAIVVKRKEFVKLLQTIEESFGSLSKYEITLQNRITSTTKFIRRLMIITVITSIFSVVAYFSKPILTSETSLPLRTFHPRNLESSPNYEFAYFLQVVVLTLFESPCLLGFDFLFISLTTHITNELKLLSHDFSNISFDEDVGEERTKEELNLLIDHHNLILKCLEEINGIYSVLLLNQFLSCSFIMCIGLLSIIRSSAASDYDEVIKASAYLLLYSSMLFSYCSGGAHLTQHCENISDSVFMSNWWIEDKLQTCKHYLLLVICRAQKMNRITAGKMFDLNMKTFAMIVRNAFFFFVLMQPLFRKFWDRK